MHEYSASESRTRALALLAFLSVLLAIVANWASEKVSLGPAWLLSPPTVGAGFGILYSLLETRAWKWKILHELGIVRVPIVDGVYEGELVSSYGGTRVPVRICIDQTWTRLAVKFETLQPRSSTSYSIAAALASHGHDEARLTYTYRNQTRPGIAESDMNDHDGTAEVTINSIDGALVGRYFNFRGRQGTLALTRL